MRVLVIDDNEDIAFLHSKLAEACGCECRYCVSAASAVGVVEAWQPDVILLDLAMPGIDGYKLAPMLRDVSIRAGTRIVLVSGYVPDKLRLAMAGIDGHILKPVDFVLIRQLLTPSA